MRWPDFFVIGAAKSGTTSLYHYLGQHPQIFMCPVNETNFFALHQASLDGHYQGPVDRQSVEEHCIRRPERYQSLFSAAPADAFVGENSPLYLYSDNVAQQIHATVPNARLIAILRHPADRAFSNFQQYRRAGIEPLSTFEAAIEAEDSRIQAGWGPWPFWHYRQVGMYGKQLSRYYALFPSNRILVFLYEELRDDPVRLLQQIYSFLGVDAEFQPDVSVRHNISALPRSRILQRLVARDSTIKRLFRRLLPEKAQTRIRSGFHRWNTKRQVLDPALRATLVRDYQDDIRRLEHLIGRDLSHWRQ